MASILQSAKILFELSDKNSAEHEKLKKIVLLFVMGVRTIFSLVKFRSLDFLIFDVYYDNQVLCYMYLKLWTGT